MDQGIWRSVKLGIRSVDYRLVQTSRKSVGIIIGRDGQVTVRAPKRLSDAEIGRIVEKKAGWIQGKLTELEGYPPPVPPPLYINGEVHYYLGEKYTLDVVAGRAKAVAIKDGRLVVTVRDKDSRKSVERKLTAWYRAQARQVFAERLERHFPLIERHGVTPRPEIKVRKMKRRWGSCHSEGHITLNLRLIQAPLPYIDYVIIHELCHLVEPNHGRGFYQLLEKLLPDWRDRRERLNRIEVA
jgi:predicted metal-dependent hydrolase